LILCRRSAGAADVLRTIREKRLLWPGIAALAGIAALVSLGNWQMQRLAWKEGLIAAIAERTHAEPVTLAAAEERAGRGKDVEYTRVAVRGRLLNDREIHLYALDDAGDPGFHVITPLRLADDGIVLVNRGFVPNELKEPGKRMAGQLPGDITVTGLLRHRDAPSMFIPGNDAARNIWYWRDIDAMAATLGPEAVHVHRVIVDAEASPAAPGGWPKGGATRLELPNRHLEYALTWYGLAASLIAVFAAFAVTRWRQPDSE
jgi:surfeit locus 1 family protein